MRQSAAQIDSGICEVAAGIFAVHGFDHASVQQIADAVGYSKPGLLHRFGSKEALHRAVLAEVTTLAEQVIALSRSLMGHPHQLPQVLELLVVKALARPGTVHYLLRTMEQGDEPGSAALRAAGQQLVDTLALPAGSPAARLRLTLALHLIVDAAITQRSASSGDLHMSPDALVPMLVTLATQVVGVPVAVS